MTDKFESYDLETRRSKSGATSPLLIVGVALVVVLTIAALVLSIIILVKVNDVESKSGGGGTTMAPTTMKPSNGGGNINPPAVGSTEAYKTAAKFFLDSIDNSVNPCEDFYKHACGKFDTVHPTTNTTSQVISFSIIDEQVMEELVNTLNNADANNTIAPLGTVKKVYDKCKSTMQKYTAADYQKLMAKVNDLGGWPLLTQADTLPQPVDLAIVMATLTTQYGVNTIVNPVSDTKWTHPERGYRILLDQPALATPTSYYRLHPDQYKNETAEEIINEVMKFAKGMMPNANMDMQKLRQQAMDVANFEYALSQRNKLSSERRSYLPQNNTVTVADLQRKYSNENAPMQWKTYFSQLYTFAKLNATQITDSYEVTLQEPDVYNNVFNNLTWSRVTVQNYLIWRMMRTQVSFFPDMQDIAILLRKKAEESGQQKPLNAIDKECANYVRNIFPWQVGRLYIDAHYSDAMHRNATRDMVREVITGVLNGFGSNLVLLPWMTKATKMEARKKVNDLVINPLYPDYILDNTWLTTDLQNLGTVDYSKGFYELNEQLTAFQGGYAFRQLALSSAMRNDFLLTPAIVNAWYIPEYNSITFPAAIMNPPFFHPEFPTAMKYGGAGVVVGHELTHGFDDQGVEWGPTGQLGPWIDTKSTAGFKNMSNCVVNEYSTFCPRKEAPQCVSGSQTQGENIADNGGIRAAYRAYRSVQNINGADPRLPGLEMYTNDQLFFLSFAQVWCRSVTDTRLKAQLLTDVHSPAEYRVRGAVRNFPAFAAAFNCKAGDPMFPTKQGNPPRCSVWAP